MTWVRQMEFAMTAGPALVTILFAAIFVATLIWICRPGSNRHYDRQAYLPLEDSAPAAPHSTAPENRNG